MLALLRSALAELARERSGLRVVVLTGAGISKESGLATFRDAGGLWERFPLEEVATPQAYQRKPALVHEFYNLRRQDVLRAQPNAAHVALRDLEQHLGDRLTLVTQNVDDLHERAGSQNLVHMHGEVRKLRCLGAGHILEWDGDADGSTRCPQCGSAVRPHIVWFGEIPLELDRIDEALSQADVFCAIGTSGTVYPAAGFVREVKQHGGLCIEVNLEEAGGPFDVRLIGPATVQVPILVNELLQL
jgi:NAD-dependent deacetylase